MGNAKKLLTASTYEPFVTIVHDSEDRIEIEVSKPGEHSIFSIITEN